MRALALRLHATAAMAVRRVSDGPPQGRAAAGEERLLAQPTGVTASRSRSINCHSLAEKYDSEAAAQVTAALVRYFLLHS